MLRSLAACAGDAKLAPFAAAVEGLEPLRAQRAKLVRDLVEISQGLWSRGGGVVVDDPEEVGGGECGEASETIPVLTAKTAFASGPAGLEG